MTSISWTTTPVPVRPDRIVVKGHEFQRVAPACWAATLLLCGGVPRVMTWPGHFDSGKREYQEQPE